MPKDSSKSLRQALLVRREADVVGGSVIPFKDQLGAVTGSDDSAAEQLCATPNALLALPNARKCRVAVVV